METETAVPPAPRKRKKAKAKRAAAPKRAAEPKPPAGVLDGITENDCPFECGPNCAITRDICGHPNKGGLQAAHQSKPDVIRRFNEARKILSHIKVDKRG